MKNAELHREKNLHDQTIKRRLFRTIWSQDRICDQNNLVPQKLLYNPESTSRNTAGAVPKLARAGELWLGHVLLMKKQASSNSEFRC
jgi:hypothetical protein